MDLLDRLLAHDAWTTRLLLLRCRTLPEPELDREFDLAHRSLRATFLHVVWNMEAWSDMLASKPLRPKPGPEPANRSIDGLLARLDRAALDLARVAKDVRDRGAWDERWHSSLDGETRTETYGGTLAHVITHSMHHRAQIIAMMRWLGMKDVPEGDVLGWEQQMRR